MNRFKIYVNGNNVTDANDVYLSGSIQNFTPEHVSIGGNAQWDNEFLGGTIDEVAMWTRVLNSSEILSLYNYTKTKYQANFTLSGLNATDYLWNCHAYDNMSLNDWGNNLLGIIDHYKIGVKKKIVQSIVKTKMYFNNLTTHHYQIGNEHVT